eukprot:CAMPEP_0119389962 /NCGR_PEP_ID=MMETSP1334-20130426/111372_1 /TAXON_ID=127549 /ORGANISM="Calcidiscus leptoporus, Strain RCC1130" /LENGTH=170 /DNA_ID=CAMNT_0007412315 /DNA_START=190 /DNA_END=698 /DNA_ORIENTATION=-
MHAVSLCHGDLRCSDAQITNVPSWAPPSRFVCAALEPLRDGKISEGLLSADPLAEYGTHGPASRACAETRSASGGMSWPCPGHVLVMSWPCPRHVLAMPETWTPSNIMDASPLRANVRMNRALCFQEHTSKSTPPRAQRRAFLQRKQACDANTYCRKVWSLACSSKHRTP